MVTELSKKKLGFGTMRLPLCGPKTTDIDKKQFCEMIDYFISQGFNYFDTAYPYHDGESEKAVGECLCSRYPRESFLLADKMPFWNVGCEDDLERIFNEQLEKTKAQYFDLYLMHSMNKDTFKKCEGYHGFEFGLKKKEEGKIRNLGFSFHDTPELLDEIITKHPYVDFVQLQINYYDWEKANVQSRACYEVCVKHGKHVVVMEPIKGGYLSNMEQEYLDRLNTLEGQKMSGSSYAIRFAASLENVFMVLSGMSNIDQMKDNVSYMKDFQALTIDQKNILNEVTEFIDRIPQIPCTSCEYCVKGCPAEIYIPKVFKILNNQAKFNNFEANKARYQELTKNGGLVSNCIECCRCESHCPQHIEIHTELKKAKELFE